MQPKYPAREQSVGVGVEIVGGWRELRDISNGDEAAAMRPCVSVPKKTISVTLANNPQ